MRSDFHPVAACFCGCTCGCETPSAPLGLVPLRGGTVLPCGSAESTRFSLPRLSPLAYLLREYRMRFGRVNGKSRFSLPRLSPFTIFAPCCYPI